MEDNKVPSVKIGPFTVLYPWFTFPAIAVVVAAFVAIGVGVCS